ncbi:MAG: flagellar hook-basal body complex protein FliE [Firmicutes bacterium]|jgi:flagellar hook-basal body complex protein FliE|nr:flagellar hook-basal body complex protein FliE [Bacillota bacterium]
MNINGISKVIGQADKIKKVDIKNQGADFKDFLVDAIDKVNQAQIESVEMDNKLAVGETDNLHDVMIAAQKADLMLNFAVQVNNKVLSAYKEIMRLQI